MSYILKTSVHLHKKFVNATALQWLRFGVNFKMEFVAAIKYVSGGALQRRYNLDLPIESGHLIPN